LRNSILHQCENVTVIIVVNAGAEDSIEQMA
jgi:hypothetical protein